MSLYRTIIRGPYKRAWFNFRLHPLWHLYALALLLLLARIAELI